MSFGEDSLDRTPRNVEELLILHAAGIHCRLRHESRKSSGYHPLWKLKAMASPAYQLNFLVFEVLPIQEDVLSVRQDVLTLIRSVPENSHPLVVEAHYVYQISRF